MVTDPTTDPFHLRVDYELNPAQYAFVTDFSSEWLAYIGGIGAGKSFAGALKALKLAKDYPGSLGLIGAPTHPMIRDSTLRSVWEVWPRGFIKAFNRSTGNLYCANGSEVLVRSMSDPDANRGPNLTWFWLDEGPLCGYEAWRIMKGRVRQNKAFHQGFITGTPHGEDEFYADFELHRQPGHSLYRARTQDNAHNLPDGYALSTGYTGKFALQELEGLFVSFEGLVYEFHDSQHLGEWGSVHHDANGQAAPMPRSPLQRIGGVDWGYTNPSVALPIWIDGDDRAFVLDEYYVGARMLETASPQARSEAEPGFEGVAKAILDYTRRYHIATWYCGPDEPEHIDILNKMLHAENLASGAVAAVDDINPGLETVRRQLALRGDGRPGFYLSARAPQTRQEFKTYSYGGAASRRATRDPQEKPVKAMDHALDALRYALHSTLGVAWKRGAVSQETWARLHQPAPASDLGGVTLFDKRF